MARHEADGTVSRVLSRYQERHPIRHDEAPVILRALREDARFRARASGDVSGGQWSWRDTDGEPCQGDHATGYIRTDDV